MAEVLHLIRECVHECKQMSGPEQAAALDAHQTGCWFSCSSASCKQIQMDNFAKREKQEKWERKNNNRHRIWLKVKVKKIKCIILAGRTSTVWMLTLQILKINIDKLETFLKGILLCLHGFVSYSLLALCICSVLHTMFIYSLCFLYCIGIVLSLHYW